MLKQNNYLNYKYLIGLSLLLCFKFYFFSISFFATNFNLKPLIIQSLVLFLFNLFLIYFVLIFLDRVKKNHIFFNIFSSVILSLFLVYILKTYFYFVNIITFKEFIYNIFNVLSLSNSYKLLLTFFLPYFLFFILLLFFDKKNNKNFFNFFSILGVIFILYSLIDLSVKFFQQTSAYNIINEFKPYEFSKFKKKKNRKAIWLILDSFDPQFAFETKSLRLESIKAIINQSLYFENIYPPSDSSLHSMTANLIGSEFHKLITKKGKIEMQGKNQKFIKFEKENTIFGRLEKNNIEYEVYSSLIDYCSILGLENCKAPKYKLSKNSDSIFYGIKSSYPIISQFKYFLNIIKKKKTIETEILNADIDLFKYKEKLDKLNDIDGFGIMTFSDIENFINSNKSLLFAHLRIPKEPANQVRKILNLNLKKDHQINLDEYLLNLKYTDYTIKRIFDSIKKLSTKDEIIIILMSDHHYKLYKGSAKKNKVLQLIKILNSNEKLNIKVKTNTIHTQELLHKYLVGKINNINDIENFYKNKTYTKATIQN